uniref:Lipoprotein n=1 Tax=Ralstonia solanacearum TaxID=305 RepID=A0A0S4VEK9_RALSL|nr:exported protein of unknown function [Ralstonia solanacearum]CUV33079.1 exported protein of unknown function [Ralstonia solanacearum]CUV38714.1 exported protein of unknown function [Ralstonia solanacearum]CUV61276.1 exported protein of unknown function [Ralstonia solanacearum]
MKRLFLCGAVAIVLQGCAYSISDVDISHAQPECARQCTVTYSQCVSGGPAVGFKTETLRACHEAYAACVSTCKSIAQRDEH